MTMFWFCGSGKTGLLHRVLVNCLCRILTQSGTHLKWRTVLGQPGDHVPSMYTKFGMSSALRNRNAGQIRTSEMLHIYAKDSPEPTKSGEIKY